MSRSSLNKNAFSLIELIVTIGILSIGIVAVLRAFAFCAGMAGLSNDIIDAVFLTEDKMQELEFYGKDILANKEPAAIQDKKDKFLYGYALDLDSTLNLYKLDFKISWPRASRREKLEFATYLKQ